ncbi:MAG: 2-hydroxyacid dehydrogenase, partial [Lachnospiraceae bacterium]|nr:2-hydroxyacid dehydrogenase [Lachnospiraceae bacterium]
MNILFFGTKSYDKQFFETLLKSGSYHDLEITFIEPKLEPETARLADGYEAVCAFVNMDLSEKTIRTLAKCGVKLVLMRCAGFNNVDLDAAKECGIT